MNKTQTLRTKKDMTDRLSFYSNSVYTVTWVSKNHFQVIEKLYNRFTGSALQHIGQLFNAKLTCVDVIDGQTTAHYSFMKDDA